MGRYIFFLLFDKTRPANVTEPSICPILSFAIYVFTKGYDRQEARTTIFVGDSESQLSKWPLKLCHENTDLLTNQRIDILRYVKYSTPVYDLRFPSVMAMVHRSTSNLTRCLQIESYEAFST